MNAQHEAQSQQLTQNVNKSAADGKRLQEQIGGWRRCIWHVFLYVLLFFHVSLTLIVGVLLIFLEVFVLIASVELISVVHLNFLQGSVGFNCADAIRDNNESEIQKCMNLIDSIEPIPIMVWTLAQYAFALWEGMIGGIGDLVVIAFCYIP